MKAKRELLISKGWMQAVVIVGLCGFLFLAILAYRTYTDEPPIPFNVLGSEGQLLFTGQDVMQVAPQLTVAIGLAMRRLGDKK